MYRKSKILIIFVGCMLLRFIPFRAPNVEPIMAGIMPLGRKYGAVVAFLFGFSSIMIFDFLTNFGSWSWIAGITYGLIGVASTIYFKKFKASIFNFAVFAFFATIVFDMITGVLFAPMFHQTTASALMLQIPFTILHLAGNIGFALTLSPILGRWLATEKVFALERRVRIAV